MKPNIYFCVGGCATLKIPAKENCELESLNFEVVGSNGRGKLPEVIRAQ